MVYFSHVSEDAKEFIVGSWSCVYFVSSDYEWDVSCAEFGFFVDPDFWSIVDGLVLSGNSGESGEAGAWLGEFLGESWTVWDYQASILCGDIIGDERVCAMEYDSSEIYSVRVADWGCAVEDAVWWAGVGRAV